MELTNKNREDILALCLSTYSYQMSRKVSERLLKWAEKNRVKKIVAEAIAKYNSSCLCEVVGANKPEHYEMFSLNLAFEFQKAIDDDKHTPYNKGE